MRDLGQWLGARECTRECIGKALDDGVSVILVPGGQAEIFSTRSWGDDVTVFRGHRGFVQLALRHRARLVPVFSFGEWEIMDNVYLPALQRRTRKWFGFPVPFATSCTRWVRDRPSASALPQLVSLDKVS